MKIEQKELLLSSLRLQAAKVNVYKHSDIAGASLVQLDSGIRPIGTVPQVTLLSHYNFRPPARIVCM